MRRKLFNSLIEGSLESQISQLHVSKQLEASAEHAHWQLFYAQCFTGFLIALITFLASLTFHPG